MNTEALSPELVKLGSTPVREGVPAGDNARDEPEFEALKEEMRKLELPDQPAIDWSLVVRNAGTILESKSKDLLVVSYLCVGLLERDGFSGLATGLTILKDIIGGYWESLHPELKRVRGRVAAIEWLAERGAQRVRRQPPPGGNQEAVALCLELVNEVGELLAPRLDSGGVLLGELRRSLEEASAAMSRPAPTPSTTTVSAPTSSPQLTQFGTEDDVQKALTEARRLILGVSGFLGKADPKNPAAYSLPRAVIWARLTQLPPEADGKTQIPEPGDVAAKLQEGLEGAEWPGVLRQAEDFFPNAVLWLDLHRYTVTALEALGEEYHPAADAVCAELRLMLARLPGLQDLRFRNDDPLADEQTRSWIQSRVLAVGSGGGDPSPAPAPSGESATEEDSEGFEEAKTEAWKLARKRKLGEALRLLEQGATRAPSLPSRVRWKLEMSRICVHKKEFALAIAQLENLDGELGRSTFEDWDPIFAAEIIKSLYHCRQKVLSTQRQQLPAEIERSQDLLGRLARLDVLSALELNGKK